MTPPPRNSLRDDARRLGHRAGAGRAVPGDSGHRHGRHQPRLFGQARSSSRRLSARSKKCMQIRQDRRTSTDTLQERRRRGTRAVDRQRSHGQILARVRWRAKYTSQTTMTVRLRHGLHQRPNRCALRHRRHHQEYSPMFSTKWAGANSDGSYTPARQSRDAHPMRKRHSPFAATIAAAAAIEMAIALPVLVSFIWGIFQLGHRWSGRTPECSTALGEGARYATLCVNPTRDGRAQPPTRRPR